MLSVSNFAFPFLMITCLVLVSIRNLCTLLVIHSDNVILAAKLDTSNCPNVGINVHNHIMQTPLCYWLHVSGSHTKAVKPEIMPKYKNVWRMNSSIVMQTDRVWQKLISSNNMGSITRCCCTAVKARGVSAVLGSILAVSMVSPAKTAAAHDAQ